MKDNGLLVQYFNANTPADKTLCSDIEENRCNSSMVSACN